MTAIRPRKPRWQRYHISYTVTVGGRPMRESISASGHGAEDAIRRHVPANASDIHATDPGLTRSDKSRGVAILLAIFLGGIGAQRYYLGSPGIGLIYTLFFWTGIPLLLSWAEAIILLMTSDDAFNFRHAR